MNANLKGGNALVRFLLSHGEKLGMLGIVVCTGMLIWGAMGVAQLEDRQTPSELNRISNQATDKINKGTWKADDIESEIIVVSEPMADGEAEMKMIPNSDFPLMEPINRPVLKQIALRTDPILLAPEDLEVNGDFGLWASADPNEIKQKQLQALREEAERLREEADMRDRGDEDDPRGRGEGFGGGRLGAEDERRRSKGPIVMRPQTGVQLDGYEEITARSWVTVLARVPVKQQYQMYSDALEEARGYDPSTDIPEYIGYSVERAEVTDSGQGEWIEIATVGEEDLIDELETYPHNPADVIDPRVDHSLLTHPLPPLILREWDSRVSHSSMPLADELDPYEDLNEDLGEDGMQGDEGDDSPFRRRESTRGNRRGEFEDDEMMRRPNRRPGSRARAPMRRGGEFEVEGRMGGGGRGSVRGMGSGVTLGGFAWDGITSHILLRFFDHTDSLKEGHRYRYRIRLALQDVNDGVSEKYLDNTVTERKAQAAQFFRYTEWSKPSGIASVPLTARVFLVETKPAKDSTPNDESEVEFLIKALNSEFAAEIAVVDKFVRGSVMNLLEAPEVMWTSQNEDQEIPDKLHFRTGITLLDVQGGKKISKDYSALSRVLMMDPAGKLFVQAELDDEETVEEYEYALESGKDDRRRGFEGGFGRGGEFEGAGF